MQNVFFCKYTYVHKKIIEFMVNKYCTDEYIRTVMLERVKDHDMDKLTSYLFYPKNVCSKIHRENNSHHINELEKDMIDYIEMVFDWESARYSKDDKPLNAYDTLYKYYPYMEEHILPILKGFGLDKSDTPLEKDIKEYADSLINSITEDDIINEVIEYVKRLK